MGYDEFYDIAEYANINWNKGGFTNKEVAMGAYDYLVDYETSCKKGRPVGCINTLLSNLEEDITDPKAWEWSKHLIETIERRQ